MFWRINPACNLRWRRWDDQFIVFNAASGQTHYLSELAVTVFELLQQRSFNAATLIQCLTNHYDDFCPDEDTRIHLDTLLASLDDLGLIEPDCL
ncbi:MAG: HPr-rel-A system PqqD family peptide chaperone [Gammaproteobacteria bacterium]|nr:HPr-rel-A system PqqD family peptide chaperone [Gammaproteobacteria bacterium]MCP5196347.1 HPr-rel-A system PqqD family peptide chaperone [Gammaproteobacteria bacterium]